jgi:amino acid adenylation domain-containing protein
MNTAEFLSQLHGLDIRLAADGQRLRVNAPRGTLTANLREQISQRKAEILQFLQNASAVSRFAPPPIRPLSREQPMPVSFAQERLWFLEQLEPGSSVYNVCRAARLRGELSVKVLESSLTEVMRRHEALRTSFQLVDGRAFQVMRPAQKLSISLIDLSSLSDAERDSKTSLLIREEARRPFDLSKGPFLRATLLRRSDDDHVLVVTTHHIVSDAWSMGILTRELWILYETYANENPSPFPELTVQYADYAVWQREWLQGEVLESQLAYWKTRLDNIPIVNLPTDRPRPAKQSFRGARESIALSESLTAAINELSRREGVTQFMTLLAAFNVLLYRYSGQEDLVVGSPIANRNRTELEGLIGFFVNTVVLRADLSGNPTFKELLVRVRDVCLKAYRFQHLPFEKLVKELQPDRDLSRNPLFQVMFVLQNASNPVTGISGLRIESIELETTRSPLDLSLFLRERNRKYVGHIEYSTELFNRNRIERMAGHFQTLLQAIVSYPDQFIVTLPILTAAERHQILVEWNDTAADYPKDKCIHQLFEAQVERTPDAIALEFDGKEIRYRELNRRANQLAHYLITLGIGPEKLVGICVERSLEMVIGLLGILKAGGAYVPLEPTYPRERIAFIMEDSKASVLVTSGKLLTNFLGYNGVSVSIDDSLSFQGQKEGNPKSGTNANDPAYIIYTSGSTGTPKGVIGLHRGVVNRMAWMWIACPFSLNEKSCLKTSLSFVDSVWEIFGPLLQGVPTLVISDEVVTDPRSLVRTLADYGVTRIVLVPSLLRTILDEGRNLQQQLSHQMIWTSSGEHLPRRLVDQFQRSLPNSILLNLYGSSEVSADITWIDVRSLAAGSRIPIGRPISNTKIYLLDSQRQLVPIGVLGELYVGGVGLARGYLNRPDLTAEKFVTNPFGSDSDRRLYRTGDLARYLPDGNIEFLGRADNQVKIRGHRIELGEIESVLNEHPTVRESVLVAQDDISEEQREAANPKYKSRTEQSRTLKDVKYNKRLIAFVVPTQQPLAPMSELQDFLKQKLPGCMVPSCFICMEALPLTPNGKIDRIALPRPDGGRHQLDGAYVEPKTELEGLVAHVWRDALKLDELGVEDNFFQLGGHSLLAVQIVSRLRDAFKREIPLRELFEAPTVAAFSSRIEFLIRSGLILEVPSITHVPSPDKAPLSLSQKQLWYLDRLMPGTDASNMFYVCELKGSLNQAILQAALAEIVKRHEALRTVFTIDNGEPVQTVKGDLAFQLQVLDLRNGSRNNILQRVAKLIARESTRPFDLMKGPLFRARLLTLAEQEHLLLISLHHMIGDQWSMRVFRSELIAVYEAFLSGGASPLAVPAIQFSDYARWEREMLNAGVWDGQLAYWREQLAGPLSRLQFAGAKRKTTGLSFKLARQTIEFDEGRLAAIRNMAKKESCTPYMVVLTALNILLHFYTGQRDLRVGSLVANRSQWQTENVIGHFLNTIILRTVLSPEMSVIQLLKHIQKVTIAAQVNQELPFEHLVRTLKFAASPDGEALCQVLCNYQNVAIQTLAIPGLRFALWNGMFLGAEPNVRFTTFDLFFYFWEASTKLTLAVNYKADIFGKRLIGRMLRNLDQILAIVTSRPDNVLPYILADPSLIDQ